MSKELKLSQKIMVMQHGYECCNTLNKRDNIIQGIKALEKELEAYQNLVDSLTEANKRLQKRINKLEREIDGASLS